jgi:hypothetical protein
MTANADWQLCGAAEFASRRYQSKPQLLFRSAEDETQASSLCAVGFTVSSSESAASGTSYAARVRYPA